jgi:hypothetical protein
MSQIPNRNPSLTDADYERRQYWTISGGMFLLYTLLGVGCCVLYFKSLGGLTLVPPIAIALLGGLYAVGLLTMSPWARDSADTFLPLAFAMVIAGQLYEKHLNIGAPLWAMLVLMVVCYVVLFRTRKGPYDDREARIQIVNAGKTSSYRDEYIDASSWGTAGMCLLAATVILYAALFTSTDPTSSEIQYMAAHDECELIQPIPQEGEEAKDPIDPCNNTTNMALQWLLRLMLIPGLVAGYGLMTNRKWASGLGDVYMGMVFGLSIFVFLAYSSMFGAFGAALPFLSGLVAAIGLRPAMKLQRGISDATLKEVPATQALIARAESAPAFSTEEYESWADWTKTGQLLGALTVVELICLFLFNADFFARISASLSDGMVHFPGYELFSILVSLGTGALCAFGMMKHVKWVRGLAEMRIALGAGQVLVYLLASQLLVSAQIWRAIPFVALLILMVPTYLALGKTRRAYYQG